MFPREPVHPFVIAIVIPFVDHPFGGPQLTIYHASQDYHLSIGEVRHPLHPAKLHVRIDSFELVPLVAHSIAGPNRQRPFRWQESEAGGLDSMKKPPAFVLTPFV
jgi:hypothetical protein